MTTNWDDRYEYLRDSLELYHNLDYWEFLVQKVWRLDRPCRVVDFGSGYGRMGLVLMRLLPAGSTYTGIDASEPLLQKGRELWQDLPCRAQFIRADVHSVPLPDDCFDLAFCHTVLMHIPRPQEAVAEMVRVTCDGGMAIACEATRNAFAAMFHIEEIDQECPEPLWLPQRVNRQIRLRTDVDYNIGKRVPFLLHKAGVKQIGCRISDAVGLLLPPCDTTDKRERLRQVCIQGFGDVPGETEAAQRWMSFLTTNGLTEQEASDQIARAVRIDFAGKGGHYHVAFPGLITVSYGRVCKRPEA